MRRPFIYSLILHLLVIVLAIFGLPSLRQPPAVEEEPVVVELATVAEKTNPPPVARSAPPAEANTESGAPKPEPAPPVAEAKPEPRPQPQPKFEAAPARPIEPQVAKPEASPLPAPEAMARPEPRPGPAGPEQSRPEREMKSEPKKVANPEPEPQPKAEPRPQAKPKPPVEQRAETAVPESKPTSPPQRKPEPPGAPDAGVKAAQTPKPEASKPNSQKPESARKEREPETASDFSSVSRTVDQLRQQSSKGEHKPAKPAAAPAPARANTDESESGFTSQVAQALRSSSATAGTPSPVTTSEIDAVRRQIERCWNLPGGGKEAGNVVVSIRVEMNLDGTPRSAVVVNSGQMQANPYYQAVADSARRAVLNPRCHPFKLPPEKYDHWRAMTLIFNPKEMS